MGTVPRSSGIRTVVPAAIGRSAPPSRTRVTSPRSSLPRTSISVVAVIGANVSGVATTRSMRGRRSGLTSMSRSRTGSGTILSKSGSIRTTEAWYAIDSAYGVWKNTDQSFESSSRFIGRGDNFTRSIWSSRSVSARDGRSGGLVVAAVLTPAMSSG